MKKEDLNLLKTLDQEQLCLLLALSMMRNQYCWEAWHYHMSAGENCYETLYFYWLIDNEFWIVDTDIFYNLID